MGRFPVKPIRLGKQIEIMSKVMDYSVTSGASENYFGIFGGSGAEFKGHREYGPGSDSKRIDWKASLRSDKLLVKEFFQEKGMDVIFVYDVSESMLFGSQSKIKAHYGAEFILALAGTAMEANYNIGLVCFSDKVRKVFLPSSGGRQYSLMVDVLSNHSTYGGKFKMKEVLSYVSEMFNPGSVIVLVSDFLGDEGDFLKYKSKFRILSHNYDVISVVLRDVRDEFMPAQSEEFVVSDPYSGRKIAFVPSKIKDRFENYAKHQRKELFTFLNEVKSECLPLYTDKSFVSETISFFERRGQLSK
jgi:uncharacterized protein (DUF58 family)